MQVDAEVATPGGGRAAVLRLDGTGEDVVLHRTRTARAVAAGHALVRVRQCAAV